MAKKIVRGITDVKTINNQDFDTNNVNDLLSDGQYNYIHRKKGENEEYHNLTDNIKTISSDNTELLAVTNYNKTTNTATLHPKHDAQKEQVLESTRNTVTINHGENGTAEKTTVDTNPKKVLEHENLTVGGGLVKSHTAEQNTTNLSVDFNTVQQKMSAGDGLSISNNKISIKPTSNRDPLNNGFYMGNLINDNSSSSIISLQSENNRIVQLAFRESDVSPNLMIMRYRFVTDGAPTDWKLATIDNEQLLSLLARKEQVIESTRKTIAINRGEKTTVDTNPLKVLEHENLLTINGISKVTEGNVTTIGLKTIDNYSGDLNELTETCLVKPSNDAGNLPIDGNGQGILSVVKTGDTVSQKYHDIDNTVYTRLGKYFEGAWEWSSWSGGSASHTIEYYLAHGLNFKAFKQVVTQQNNTFVTFTFDCDPQFTERELPSDIKRDLEKFVSSGMTVSNGAVSLTNDGTNMKLIKSGASDTYQQGTFTFFDGIDPM